MILNGAFKKILITGLIESINQESVVKLQTHDIFKFYYKLEIKIDSTVASVLMSSL